MFGFLKPGPNHSLTYYYLSTHHPNMVGCSNDCSDPNSEPVIDLSRLNTFCRNVQNGNFIVHQGLSNSRGMGVVDRPVCRHLHIPFHRSPRKYLTLSLGWIINQELSELKPIQVFLFMGYEYHLDSALVKPTQRDGSIFGICSYT